LTGLGNLQGNSATVILPDSTSTTISSAPSNTIYVTTGRIIPYDISLLTIEMTTTQAPAQTAKSGSVSSGPAVRIAISNIILAGIGAGAFFYWLNI
jgi:hypothetical protein